MKSLDALLHDHSLSDSVALAEAAVKAAPGSADPRATWVQLLLLHGDWARGRVQLQAWQALTPVAKPTTQQLTDTVAAEIQRERVFRAQAAPEFLTPPQAWMTMLVSAMGMENARACDVRDEAFELAAASGGELLLARDKEETVRESFNWLADADSRLGPVCELIIDSRYCWVPYAELESITFQAPQNVVHLVWAHAMVKWRSGRQQVCQIPARYPLLEDTPDEFRLGRKTDWLTLGREGHYTGIGQKTLLTDNDEFAILPLRSIQFREEALQ
ncbi:protein of avirulence locus ImpE [Enterobacteriaceae bacterium 4M9]|nr:protein of avirulence locus ImpE [Enterobacteriaceae bacterium 4M9]